MTVGQRRGLGLSARTRPERRYIVDIDLPSRTATLGTLDDLLVRPSGSATCERRDSPWPAAGSRPS